MLIVRRLSQFRGFTMIELLVVVAIIGILASLLLPVLAKAKNKASRLRCAGNLKQITMSLQSFANDNGSRFPWFCTLEEQKSFTAGLGGVPAFQGQDPANQYARHVGTIFCIHTIRDELGSVDMLLSPVDPEAQASNEDMELNYRALTQLDLTGISYSVCHGGDQLSPSTICGVTRNTEYPSLKPQSSRLSISGGRASVKVARNPPGPTTRFVGADEITETTPPQEVKRLSMLAMSGMMKSQGQVSRSDGSVEQMSDYDFDKTVEAHLKSRGGNIVEQPETSISRPFQPPTVPPTPAPPGGGP